MNLVIYIYIYVELKVYALGKGLYKTMAATHKYPYTETGMHIKYLY